MINKDYTAEVLSYIEHNLNVPFNIDDIPIGKYISTMQLYRDFYNLTGHSVKEYIRKRRLSNALALVKHSDMSLIDIAYSCGYSSQQAFCKCVKAATGQTPLEYKESGSYYYFPMFCSKSEQQIAVSTETIPRMICLKYYHSQIRGIENRAVNYLLSLLPGYEGRIFGRNGKQLDNRLCYELYIEYDDETPEKLKNSSLVGMTVVPEINATFAKTAAKNIDDEINSAWDYLYIDWLKTSMFEQSDMQYFEEYIRRDGKIKKLVLYLPVRKRNDYNRISLKACDEMFFLVSRKNGVYAEEGASKAVMEFLSSHYPYLVKTTRQFYVAKNGVEYTCGVGLEKELHLPQDSGLEILHIDSGNYAVLEGECCGDSSVYEEIILSWINENSFETDASPVFAIYETDGSFEQKNIKAKIYVKMKNVKNG